MPLDDLSQKTLSVMVIFLPIAVIWWALLLWPGFKRSPIVAIMSGLSLMIAWDLLLTTAGESWYYPRIHTPFDPLLFLVVAGSLIYALSVGIERLRTRFTPHAEGTQ